MAETLLPPGLGTPRAIAGNTPLLLDRPDQALLVLEGEVELFLVPLEEGRPAGLRRHLFGLGRGALLFGVDGAAEGVGLLAVGHVGTRVAELPPGALQGWAADPARRAGLETALERWVQGLTGAMVRPIQPRPRLETLFQPGETARPAAGRRAGPARGIAWARPEGAAFYLDTGEVAAGETLPLAAGAWLEQPQDAPLPSLTTGAALERGLAWAGLATLHRLMLEILPLNLMLAAADEANRQRARHHSDREAGEAALQRLAEPLAGARPFRPPVEGEQPLLRTVAAIASHLGLALTPPPPRREQGEIRPATLGEILRANQLRARGLRLQPGWWGQDAGPLLLLRQGDGRPLALLPRPLRGGWQLYDPVEEKLAPLSARAAAALRGEAFQLYAPLPARPLRGLDIGGNLLRWARSDALAVVGLGAAAGLLNLGVPLATGVLVDSIIPAYDLPRLLEMALVLGLLALVMLVLRYAVQIAALRIEGRAGTRLQAAVIDRLLRLPMGFFRGHSAGMLAKRALAVQVIERAVGGALIGSLLTGLLSLLSLGLMAWYSWRLTLVALAMLVLLLGVTLLLGWLRIRHEREVVSLGGESAGLLLQLASGIAKLRLAAAEQRAFLRWARLQAKLARQRFLAEQIGTLSELSGTLALPLATAALFLAIHWMGLGHAGTGTGAGQQGLALGALLAFLNAFSQSLSGIAGLAGAAVQIAALRPVYAHAAPILETVPETGEHRADPGTLSGALEVSRVSFRYGQDGPPLFDDLSLGIAAGEYVAIVGPSGSGKSSLLRLLLGFEQPQAGAILYDGQDLNGLDPQALRRQLGVVLQGGRLMPGSLLENILGPNLHLSEREAWAAAEQVGLAEDLRAMPMGMQTVISDSGSTLSGGQVQRVLLARAVVARPRILLLDEATSALDNRTQAQVTESLDRLNATRIVIAHRLSTVVRADRILVLREGRICESGRYEELIAAGGFFRALAERQLL
ncbi:NHLP bacteriocin export ABC transporter permease/ATPase subunit [Pseudoroseomonas cervicalis]|uniref:NHLP bacteriocin export ABC transporter permease/ATPase subunit n=1 Tax=Teichococcus cervicalis TaxID=204525 RepID=UPI00278AC1DC|nr:NHLP bacteriocin export ABC transporter permease/ATPase subunit [Pseudoroseomonas cervicalis]MDQ1078126.1 NHLM bacteriocin system ABC transporter ATP-binding protein [Pseudoroseomonas cervicalis]